MYQLRMSSCVCIGQQSIELIHFSVLAVVRGWRLTEPTQCLALLLMHACSLWPDVLCLQYLLLLESPKCWAWRYVHTLDTAGTGTTRHRTQTLHTHTHAQAAGEIVALGSDVSTETWHVGDKVMALLAGGGNAEYVPVHAGHIMRVPDSLTMREAGGTPETWLTAFQLLHLLAQVQAGDRVLIYAAGSGVGTAATQLAVRAGATVFAVAGSDDKLHTAASLGAAHVANYKSDPDWSDHLLAASDGGGVDVVLDCVGGSFAEHTMKLLAPDSRWVVFGLMGGPQLEGPALGVILRKRVQVMGTTLRARSDEYKTALVAAFTKSALHALGDGLQVVVDRALPLAEINEAHAIMGRNENKGKIVLHVFGDE